MISRAFGQDVVVVNPAVTVRRDADDTTDLPGLPGETPGRADLWQLNVQQQVFEDGAVVADWAGIFDPALPLTAVSRVRDVASGQLFRVHGQPEAQRSLLTGELVQIAARLKFISDQQGAPS